MGTVNENLRSIREKAHKSQQAVAEYLGITRQAYSHYEVGRRKPDYDTLIKLGEYFGVTADYLLGNENRSITVGQKCRQSIAANLRRARRAAGYTEKAAAAEADVTVEDIERVESGEIEIQYGDKLLEALCDVYHVTPREIIEPCDERAERDEELKFALFGGYSGITDEMYREVVQFAEFVKKREAQKKKE